MKKILALTLSILMLFTLAACAGEKTARENPTPEKESKPEVVEIENKVDLSLDKETYAKDDTLKVSLDFGKLDQSTAVVLLVKTDKEHNKAISSDDSAVREYRYLADFSEIPFFITLDDAPDGLYDVRVYADPESGKELASVSIAVGNAVLPKKNEKTTK